MFPSNTLTAHISLPQDGLRHAWEKNGTSQCVLHTYTTTPLPMTMRGGQQPPKKHERLTGACKTCEINIGRQVCAASSSTALLAPALTSSSDTQRNTSVKHPYHTHIQTWGAGLVCTWNAFLWRRVWPHSWGTGALPCSRQRSYQ